MMEAVEQGSVTLSGIPCEGAPFQLKISQELNGHGVLEAAIWLLEEHLQTMIHVPVMLEAAKQNKPPLFCGIVTSFTKGREKGRHCGYIRVQTNSILMDNHKQNRSFQNQSRSFEQLAGLIAAPYQAICAWQGGDGIQPVGRFFLQYEETDWEFLKRVASQKGYSVFPEARQPHLGCYIGLPDSREEIELEAQHYSVKSQMAGSQMEDGTLSAGIEYVVRNRYEILNLGDPVKFQGQSLVVAKRETVLQNGLLQSNYVLRPATGFAALAIQNEGMIGAAVPGTVLESSPDLSRLGLSTDLEGETQQSWHSRSVFYTGGGKGYGGRPENGDTMYLYFPTENESDRTVIGGAGVGFEQLKAVTQQIMDDAEAEAEKAKQKEQQTAMEKGAKDLGLNLSPASTSQSGGKALTSNSGSGSNGVKKADASNTHPYKNWSTPGGRVLSLNSGGIRLHGGGGKALSLNGNGVALNSKGTMGLTGTDLSFKGKQVQLQAKEYVYIKCGMSEVALLPTEIHIKATNVFLKSPLNESKGNIYNEAMVEEIKSQYYEAKWGNPIPLFMPDGTPIGIHKREMLNNQALRDHFTQNVLGTEGYDNYFSGSELDNYLKYSRMELMKKQKYEEDLYRKWLGNTYGKTDYDKFIESLSTLEGLHGLLDGAGFFFEGADGLNAIIYVLEGDLANATISLVGMIPLLGDLWGKSAKYMAKGVDAVKLARPGSKAVKMLDNVTVFAKATKADIAKVERNFKMWTDQLADMFVQATHMDVVTPEGFIFRMPADPKVNVTLDVIDEAGDRVRFSKVVEGGSGPAKITSNTVKHVNNNHNPNTYAKQLQFKPKEAVIKELEYKSFFNSEWSSSTVEDAVNFGYNKALDNGISSGTYTFLYNGDSVTVALKNGAVETAYGNYHYTYEQLLNMGN